MRLSILFAFGLGVTVLLPLNGAAEPQTLTETPSLQPGDHLRITVLGEDKDLSGEFEVAHDSTVKHPLYSQLKVVGVPLPMLKDRFVIFLRRFQKEPQLQVEPLFKVGVEGEVKTPNIYFLAPETTIPDALTRANGLTEHGDGEHVSLIRDGKTISINLGNVRINRDQLTVRSGDQITVAARRNIIAGMGSMTPLLSVAATLLSATLLILNHR